MMKDDLPKHRRSLWLRSERAFGLESVRMPQPIEPDAPLTPSQSPPPQPASAAQLFAPNGEADFAPMMGESLSREEKIAKLAQMDAGEVKSCTRCRLCETRKNTVFGEGDPDAKIFFIGEGPGETEDLQGRPFVGRAGELLNKMIAGMGLRRQQVFIANIVKCRPPDNRVPAPDEVETCTPYLVRQLEIIRPKVIVTLGLPSAKYMLNSRLSMGKMRGQWYNWRGIKLMPTFHPAFLLRSYTEENRAAVWSDLKQVMAEVGLPIPSRASG
ncbi:MAG: uracil-DNA glycosylase [Tepidisphaeraceae bacterium]|jgi:DNA polymerase